MQALVTPVSDSQHSPADSPNNNTARCRYKSDIALMQQLGLKHLRLSISWSRLLPGGRKGTAVNDEAVKFYSGVLDSLAAAGGQA